MTTKIIDTTVDNYLGLMIARNDFGAARLQDYPNCGNSSPIADALGANARTHI